MANNISPINSGQGNVQLPIDASWYMTKLKFYTVVEDTLNSLEQANHRFLRAHSAAWSFAAAGAGLLIEPAFMGLSSLSELPDIVKFLSGFGPLVLFTLSIRFFCVARSEKRILNEAKDKMRENASPPVNVNFVARSE